MTDNLPKFDSPPVVETVLSAQFSRIKDFSSTYAGIYWKQCLGKEWTGIKQANPIAEAYEKFGKDRLMVEMEKGTIELKIGKPGQEEFRHQISTKTEERMIQVQDTRFTYNWIKKDAEYPSYETLLPEFEDKFGNFKRFISDEKLGDVIINQWEVTYVNEIYKDNLWDVPDDFEKVFPGFYKPKSESGNLVFDSCNGSWSMIIGENIGRVHINLGYGRKKAKDGPELILVRFTARGPIDEERNIDLEAGFSIGHETIVNLFHDMTSEVAHKVWNKI